MNRQAETNIDLRNLNVRLFRNLPPDYLQALNGLLSRKTFPAGVYSVTRVNQEKIMLRLSSEDGREAINVITSPVQAKESPKTAKLIFRRYGETYFLSQIWEPDDVDGRQLPKSRTERSVERDLTKRGEEPAIVDIFSTP